MSNVAVKIYVDQGVNQKRLRKLKKRYGDKILLVNVDHYEQAIKCAKPINGVFVLDKSLLDSGDYLADDELSKKIDCITFPNGYSKKSDRLDSAHLYSAYIEGCDYFVTNNPRDFVRNGTRDKLKAVMSSIGIVEIDELEERLSEIIGR